MGGGEKDRFTVQLSVAKDGTKLKPYLIFKGAAFNGAREHRRRTVAHKLFNCLDDAQGNSYLPAEKIYLICNESGNSNAILTKRHFEKCYIPIYQS